MLTAFVIGALLMTFLLSRVALFLSRKRIAGVSRLAGAHLIALLICIPLYVSGVGDWRAVMIFALAQLAWFLVDLLVLTCGITKTSYISN